MNVESVIIAAISLFTTVQISHSQFTTFPVPYEQGSECTCGFLEFPWVFCLAQVFDCKDKCASGKDIDQIRCRFGSTCSWSTGDGRGRCECPDKCSDEDQREDSIRQKFISLCPDFEGTWNFPGPCEDSFGEGWECGVVGNGYSVDSFIYQYQPNGYTSLSSRSAFLKTFDGEDISFSDDYVETCYETAEYLGNQTYSYGTDECFFCFNIPSPFS